MPGYPEFIMLTWMLPLIPSFYWLILLVVIFLMDSLVLYVWMKVKKIRKPLAVWRKSILKITLCGFAADLLSCYILLVFSLLLENALQFPNIYLNVGGFLYCAFGCLLSGLFIWLFNRFLTLRKTSLSLVQVKSAAVWIAVLTAPYILMVPVPWLVHLGNLIGL